MHYFFNTFIKKEFFAQLIEEDCVAQEVKDFVHRIVPKKYQEGKYIHKRGRILIKDEYLIPNDVLKKDPFFAQFRREKNTNKSVKKEEPKKIINKNYKNSEFNNLVSLEDLLINNSSD